MLHVYRCYRYPFVYMSGSFLAFLQGDSLVAYSLCCEIDAYLIVTALWLLHKTAGRHCIYKPLLVKSQYSCCHELVYCEL